MSFSLIAELRTDLAVFEILRYYANSLEPEINRIAIPFPLCSINLLRMNSVASTSSPREVKFTLKNHGKREVEFLYDLGVLGPRFHVVHGIWLNDKEIEFLAKTKTHVIHCPVNNAYLASGVAPVPKMLKAGVNVALGTDGPASNNNQDMIGVIKTATLLHKVAELNPTAIRCEQVMEMATIGGAKALGLEKEIGSIEPGKKAVVLVDVKKSPT